MTLSVATARNDGPDDILSTHEGVKGDPALYKKHESDTKQNKTFVMKDPTWLPYDFTVHHKSLYFRTHCTRVYRSRAVAVAMST